MKALTKKSLKEFCLMWGFNIENQEKNLLPYTLLGKMKEDAEQKHGVLFAKFMSQSTDTMDDFTYVCNESWEQMWNCWLNCKALSED